MPKYDKKSQDTVKEAMHKYKRGKLKSGRGGAKAQSREQAIAIGLSEARKKGAKVPKKAAGKSTTKRKTTSTKRKTSKKASTKRRTTSRKKTAKK